MKFDLSVLGMEIKEPAEYVISGKDDGRVEGSLTQAGMNRPIFLRAYAGGSTRSQAHAFANDIVKELRQTSPIFQTKIAFRLAARRLDGNLRLGFRRQQSSRPDARQTPGGSAVLGAGRAGVALHLVDERQHVKSTNTTWPPARARSLPVTPARILARKFHPTGKKWR